MKIFKRILLVFAIFFAIVFAISWVNLEHKLKKERTEMSLGKFYNVIMELQSVEKVEYNIGDYDFTPLYMSSDGEPVGYMHYDYKRVLKDLPAFKTTRVPEKSVCKMQKFFLNTEYVYKGETLVPPAPFVLLKLNASKRSAYVFFAEDEYSTYFIFYEIGDENFFRIEFRRITIPKF